MNQNSPLKRYATVYKAAHYNTDPCLCLEPRGLGQAYCCSLLIESPRSVTDKLQRVLIAAARVITNTKK